MYKLIDLLVSLVVRESFDVPWQAAKHVVIEPMCVINYSVTETERVQSKSVAFLVLHALIGGLTVATHYTNYCNYILIIQTCSTPLSAKV